MIASADGNILIVNFDTIWYVFIRDNSFNVNSKIGYFLSFSAVVKYSERKKVGNTNKKFFHNSFNLVLISGKPLSARTKSTGFKRLNNPLRFVI